MRAKRQRHPKYKAYFAQQMRVLQEKFPFLSSQQIRAKIVSSWKSVSCENKEKWRGQDINNEDESPWSHDTNEIQISLSGSSQRIHQPLQLNYQTAPSKENKKKVRFIEPIFSTQLTSTSESTTESCESPAPVIDEFQSIMEHELVFEEGAREVDNKSDDDDDDDDDGDDYAYPLFGDFFTRWKKKRDDKKKTEKSLENRKSQRKEDELMCNLFEHIEPDRHEFQNRLLTCMSPSIQGVDSVGLFEADNQEFFA